MRPPGLAEDMLQAPWVWALVGRVASGGTPPPPPSWPGLRSTGSLDAEHAPLLRLHFVLSFLRSGKPWTDQAHGKNGWLEIWYASVCAHVPQGVGKVA